MCCRYWAINLTSLFHFNSRASTHSCTGIEVGRHRFLGNIYDQVHKTHTHTHKLQYKQTNRQTRSYQYQCSRTVLWIIYGSIFVEFQVLTGIWAILCRILVVILCLSRRTKAGIVSSNWQTAFFHSRSPFSHSIFYKFCSWNGVVKYVTFYESSTDYQRCPCYLRSQIT